MNIVLLLVLISSVFGCQSGTGELLPWRTSMCEVDSGKVWLTFDEAIPLRIAIQIFEYLVPGDNRAHRIDLFKVPNTDTYLGAIEG